MTPNEWPIADAELMPEETLPAAVSDAIHERARAHHRLVLLMAVAVLAGSVILGPSADGRLKLPLVNFALPSVCTFQRLTGLGCPSCGLTRCFVWMSRGNVAKAFDYNPVGVVVFFLVVAQLPYRAWQLRRLARGEPTRRYIAPWVLPVILLVAMFVQWLFGIGQAIQDRLGA